MTEWNGPDRRASDRMAEGRLEEIVNRGMTRAVNEAVPKAITETLRSIGIDATNPIAMQKQMAYLMEATNRAKDPDVIADDAFTRETRLRCEKFWNTFFTTISTFATRAFIIFVLVGAVAMIGINVEPVRSLILSIL